MEFVGDLAVRELCTKAKQFAIVSYDKWSVIPQTMAHRLNLGMRHESKQAQRMRGRLDATLGSKE